MRILLIDETAHEGAATKRTFDGTGHHVESMLVGSRATERALLGGFDLVVAEWTLSRPYTRELLRALRERSGRTHTYVIVHTERYASVEVAAVFASGADDLLRRPFVREELLGRAERALRLKPYLDGAAACRSGVVSGAPLAWSEVERPPRPSELVRFSRPNTWLRSPTGPRERQESLALLGL